MVQLSMFDSPLREITISTNETIFFMLDKVCLKISDFQERLLHNKEYMIFTKENFVKTRLLLNDQSVAFKARVMVQYRMLIELVRQEFVVLKEWMGLLGDAGLVKGAKSTYFDEIVLITKELSRIRDLIK